MINIKKTFVFLLGILVLFSLTSCDRKTYTAEEKKKLQEIEEQRLIYLEDYEVYLHKYGGYDEGIWSDEINNRMSAALSWDFTKLQIKLKSVYLRHPEDKWLGNQGGDK